MSEAAGPVLTLDEVLDAVDRAHPQLEAADRKVDAALAKRLEALGAWDPRLELKAEWAPVGYYQNAKLHAVVRQATPLWGIGVFTAYRLGVGDFPLYKGDLQTLAGGELRAGLDVPLWRGGPIDAERAAIERSRVLSDAASCARRAKRLSLRQKAAETYWTWVQAGQQVRIQEELLAVARRRAAGLAAQAEEGRVPTIVVVDNERLILDREAKLVSARQKLQKETLALSLFLRDADRRTVRAAVDRVPPRLPEVAEPLTGDGERDVATALELRPEVCEVEQEQMAADVDVRLKRNQRAPKINAQAWVSRDFGAGPKELVPAELGLGLTVEMPAGLTRARGAYSAALADARQVEARLRALRDRVAVEVRRSRVDLQAARLRVDLARRQVEAARALAEAERERFGAGASDLLAVNLRELAAAEAAQLEVDALASYQRARADYLTATGLGI